MKKLKRNTEWFKTSTFRHAPSGSVNADKGIIEGVSVCTMGEAKGHGVELDSDFIDSVVQFGEDTGRSGLKARFGHPNMCDTALGTFLGRFKNFRRVGDIAKADLFLSESAKDTPNGDLHNYVLSLAESEPDMFGTSIVFEIGEQYSRDENGDKVAPEYGSDDPVYVTCDSLHACDVVDEPAANDGLFSAFSGQTLSGKITEFFDQNPQVVEALTENPEVVEVMKNHADQLAPFFEKYAATFATESITEKAPMKPEETAEPVEEKTEDTGAATEETATDETAAEETSESTETETSDEPAETPAAELSAEPEPTEAPAIDRGEFSQAVKEFGAEITCAAFESGGGYEEAQKAYYSELKAENDRLKGKSDVETAKPSEFSEEPKARAGMFNTQK